MKYESIRPSLHSIIVLSPEDKKRTKLTIEQLLEEKLTTDQWQRTATGMNFQAWDDVA
ncbi:MAG: hypothetical protein K2X93_18840 [Candidatus Obscuribacterales bacterium]|nr:hypothetical protein [Candidatus Obscuribacterales bacterium]